MAAVARLDDGRHGGRGDGAPPSWSGRRERPADPVSCADPRTPATDRWPV